MNLRLIRFDYQITQDELNENFLYKLNEEELNWALKIETELPNISKSEGDIFDVFLVDEINLKSIKKLLDKYDIEYVTSDVSSDVPNNISESFKKEIDEFNIDHQNKKDHAMDWVIQRKNQLSHFNSRKFVGFQKPNTQKRTLK